MKRLTVGSGRGWTVTAAVLFTVAITAFALRAESPAESTGADHEAAASLSRLFRHASDVARPFVVNVRAIERRPPSDDLPEAYRTGDATGIVVDRTGGILTSLHAVADAEVVSVILADGRELPVSEVRGDAVSDLAVLRVSGAGDLPEARFGDSDAVEIGDWVIAAGNSFGLGFSANHGTVSAKEVALPDSGVPLLQSNAPSNPGNSGGPLLNLRGEVVGVCEGGYSVQGGFDGISFAIPARLAEFAARELLENGSVRWPHIGASFETLSPEVAQGIGCPAVRTGAVLTHVVTDGPADEAGLHVADVVTRFGNRTIHGGPQLTSEILRTRIGETVEIGVVRAGRSLAIPLRAGRLPSIDDIPRQEHAAEPSGRGEFKVPGLGLTVANLAEEDRTDSAPGDARGVLIREVESQSPARYLGVHPGDVITHIGAEPVRDVAAFRAILGKQRPQAGAVLLVSCVERGEHFLALRPELARPPRRVEPHDGPGE